MQRYQQSVLDTSGNVIPSVTITVYNQGTTTLSTIYTGNGVTAKTNPFTTSSDGGFMFYAANGRYDILLTKTGYTFGTDLYDIQLFDNTETPVVFGAAVTVTTNLIVSGTTTLTGAVVGAVTMSTGSLTLTAGSLALTAGNVTLTAGSLIVTDGLITLTKAVTTAALTSVRAIYGKITATFAGSLTSGMIVGVRGEANIPAGTTTGGSVYVAGVQGKFIMANTGVMGHGDSRICAGLMQLDISNGTFTSGQLSALWVDAGGSASSSAVSTKGGGQFNLIRITNTTAATSNAVIYSHATADYLFDLSGPAAATGYGAISAGTTAGANPIKLKINYNGATKYLLAVDDWA